MAEPLVFSDHLCWLLVRAGHVLTTEIAAGLADLGFGPREHEVLKAALTGEHTQIELARMIGTDKTTMVVTVDALEAKGLAERRPAAHDRRARVIAVTDAGRREVAKADKVIHAIHEDVLAALDPAEREPLMRALQHLVSGRLAEPVATPPQPVRRRRAKAA
jgi:MarR family transcriptional regulator, transcriptional regulator for hemolysin